MKKLKQPIYILIIIVSIGLYNCNTMKAEVSKRPISKTINSRDTLPFPDTTDWIDYQFEDITFKAPEKWKVIYHQPNGYVFQIFPDYPDEWYVIKSERFIPSTMEAFYFDGSQEEFCALFGNHCDMDLAEEREWLVNAREDITWHIDTENTIYIEAMDGGEKTHYCYSYRYIDGQKYWLSFDGLHYLMDDTLLRLTQEDCLTAILILESMQKIKW